VVGIKHPVSIVFVEPISQKGHTRLQNILDAWGGAPRKSRVKQDYARIEDCLAPLVFGLTHNTGPKSPITMQQSVVPSCWTPI
jgi:hypothetical protein